MFSSVACKQLPFGQQLLASTEEYWPVGIIRRVRCLCNGEQVSYAVAIVRALALVRGG
jgi:hypothetical protein